jgi:hypothetical protein
MRKSKIILEELRHHLPLTFTISIVAGFLILFLSLAGKEYIDFTALMFEIIHPAHILVSAAATSFIYYKYKKSLLPSIIVGISGAILIGILSDILFPWIFGNLFLLKTSFHLPLFESPLLILVMGIFGSLGGIYIGGFKFNHSTHVFLSVFASLFYLLTFSLTISIWAIIATSIIVFLVVFIPCCISDIVFPILFIDKPCKDCGHWHG